MDKLLPWLALGAVGYVVWSKSQTGVTDMARPGVVEPLRAGVPYLFIVRLTPGVTDDAARAVVESKGGGSIVFAAASVRPAWSTPADVISDRVVSFKVTPAGNATLSLGDPFYGIGRIESIVRFDGQKFGA
jgi:hypothetical protein